MSTPPRPLYLASATFVALMSFALGVYSAQRVTARQIALIRAETGALRSEIEAIAPGGAVGTGGIQLRERPTSTAAGGILGADETVLQEKPTAAAAVGPIVEQITRRLQTDMGLFPVQLLRERRQSFVELYAHDNLGKVHYGTAGYLGRGFFITVKHGVVALGSKRPGRGDGRGIVSIEIRYHDRTLPAELVDAGDAEVEVHAGDWAIIRVNESLDLPALNVELDSPFNFAAPLLRLGNDYSNGIIASTGYAGQRTANGLITCLTDSHPGVSGGGILDQDGDLIGISVGRMDGDYRFSFILPLRREMFRKVIGP